MAAARRAADAFSIPFPRKWPLCASRWPAASRPSSPPPTRASWRRSTGAQRRGGPSLGAGAAGSREKGGRAASGAEGGTLGRGRGCALSVAAAWCMLGVSQWLMGVVCRLVWHWDGHSIRCPKAIERIQRRADTSNSSLRTERTTCRRFSWACGCRRRARSSRAPLAAHGRSRTPRRGTARGSCGSTRACLPPGCSLWRTR